MTASRPFARLARPLVGTPELAHAPRGCDDGPVDTSIAQASPEFRTGGPRRRRRSLLLTCVVFGLLSATVWSAGAASAQEPQQRGIDRVCPAPGQATSEEPVFSDVEGPHLASVECAAAYGLVSGFDDGTYGPEAVVTRGQVATFVDAWIRRATGRSLPVPDEVTFTDIDGSAHAEAIAALAETGIVGGRSSEEFAPQAQVTRGQFARITANAVSYVDVFSVDGPLPPADDSVAFTDVDGTTFAEAIGALAGAGIVLGDAEGAFNPSSAVTRGQLATFLMRAADYADRHQRWKPTAAVTVLTAEVHGVITAGDSDGNETVGTAVLTVNAFNGTLAYTLDLSDVPDGFGADGAVLRVGADGQAFLRLAHGGEIEDAQAGVLTGVVNEADSAIRFADLMNSPDDAYVWIAHDGVDGGALTGQLRPAS